MKQFKNLALLAVVVAAPSMANGVIEFKGRVLEQTCSVTVEGAENPTVSLPHVPKSYLNELGKTAGETSFTVKLAGCGESAKVATRFRGKDVSPDGRLLNSYASSIDKAGNVELQLLDGSNAISLIPGQYKELETSVIQTVQDEFEWTYAVRYYATGAATAGNVKSVLDYDVVYK